jgi:hypothetical protein
MAGPPDSEGITYRIYFLQNKNNTFRLALGGIEPPTHGFSEREACDSASIYQLVTGTFVAYIASLCITMHS